MKVRELREKSNEELNTLLKEKQEALAKFRFGMAHAKIKNIKEGREIKKDIARILTLLEDKK